MGHAEFSPKPGSHWGLLGGAFDPPHNLHLELAKSAMNSQSLTGVAFLVSAAPPHKNQPHASFSDRAALIRAHIGDNREFCVCEIEDELAPPSYTVRVVEELLKRFPEVEFTLILGSDNLAILEQWYEVDSLLKMVTALIGIRPDVNATIPEKWRERIEFIPIETSEVSSSEIREKLSQAVSVSDLTTRAVIDYIQKHKLYVTETNITEN